MATSVDFFAQRPRYLAPALVRTNNASTYLAVALFYVMLLPPQVYLNIGGSVIPPYRLMLIAGTIFVLRRALTGAFRLNWIDALVVFMSAWIGFAMFVTTDASEAFTAVVAQTADMGLAYFFARATFVSVRDLRIFLILVAPGLAATGLLIMVESLTKTHILQPWVGSLTGQPGGFKEDERLGFMRARGPFPHPIGAGIMLASFVPLYFMSGLRGWPKFAGLFGGVCAFFTVSSAALLSLTSGGGLMIYNWLSERIANLSWRILLMFAVVFFVLAEVGTGAGAYGLLVKYASLNSDSAYNRITIWIYGSQNVADNPWFGIGYGDWERPEWLKPSVDNFWLLNAMRFGLPPTIALGIVTVAAVVALALRSRKSSPSDARMQRALAITVAVYALGSISVALWVAPLVWFFMLLGFAVSLAFTSRDPSPMPSGMPQRFAGRAMVGGPASPGGRRIVQVRRGDVRRG